MSSEEVVVSLNGTDALNKLIDIWLDGFTSGAASAATTLRCPTGHATPEDHAFGDHVAHAIVAAFKADPLAIEAVRQEIHERLAGIDTGPKAFELPGLNPRGDDQ